MRIFSAAVIAGVVGSIALMHVPVAQAATEAVVYAFARNRGALPAGLIDVKGMLYGTTSAGGVNDCYSIDGYNRGCGTVFSLNPRTGKETVLHSFGKGTDGAAPEAGLIEVNGKLYGTTPAGGGTCTGSTVGCGTVFSVDPNTGTETVVHSFQGGGDGGDPDATLLDVHGTLYGTTYGVGGGSGTVFSIDPNTGTESVIYSFKGGADGASPRGPLINVKNRLYGTTLVGGAAGVGTVFSLNPRTGDETVLYSFQGNGEVDDAAYPNGNLIDLNDTLYGTTGGGGGGPCENNGGGCGTVFSVDPATGAETVVHPFQEGTDGDGPLTGLIEVNGLLYGTTYAGGGPSCFGSGCGTVFSIDPNTDAETVVYSFQGGTGGRNPLTGLIDVNGALYGTAGYGGRTDDHGASWGTVFKITL